MVYGLEFLLSYVGAEATQKGRFYSEFTYFPSNFLWRNRCLHLFFDRLHLCVNYAPFFIYWPAYHTIAFINRVTSATLVLTGLTGLFTEMVRQWDHHHTSYEFGVER